MLTNYKILKKGDLIVTQSLSEPNVKEIIFLLIKESFSVESCLIKAIDSEDALDKYHLSIEMGMV